ncbi:MAG: hypothetical protein D6798_09300, partial [Deltaproteobacteria bacterium]
PPPRWRWYRPYYAHWYVHPYYRWVHATVALAWLSFEVHAWTDAWVPPPRPGWIWVPGYWDGPVWVPGHWVPAAAAPVWHGRRYVYVPGWWVGDVYVEGYYRAETRDTGDWIWVDGYYLDDGTYVWGYWVPAGEAPDGYVWVPGFWDGDTYVDGFWRPESRPGYVWVGAWYDEDGVYHSGYWEPTVAEPGKVWIPGWFDGETWVNGYWVDAEEYEAADPQDWDPPEGWDEGWDEDADATSTDADAAEAPLALPVFTDDAAPAEDSAMHAPPPVEY